MSMLIDPSWAGQYVPTQSTLPASTVQPSRLVSPAFSCSKPKLLSTYVPVSKLGIGRPAEGQRGS